MRVCVFNKMSLNHYILDRKQRKKRRCSGARRGVARCMPKKKKKSGCTLKPGQSVEDWLDDRRARWRAKMDEDDRCLHDLQAMGFIEHMYEDSD